MADLFCTDEFTATDKLKAVERELGFRRRVYERRVQERKMTRAEADREIGVMEAIAADYRQQVQPRSIEPSAPPMPETYMPDGPA